MLERTSEVAYIVIAAVAIVMVSAIMALIASAVGGRDVYDSLIAPVRAGVMLLSIVIAAAVVDIIRSEGETY